ncbi:MAG: cation:proton antiporter [Bacteroidales bacterium]
MFFDSYTLIAILCILVILSYAYSVISKTTNIPSVLLLLGTGIAARIATDYWNLQIPFNSEVLTIFGTIGLILIVLEGTLELKITKDKTKVIRQTFFAALIILIASSLLIAGGIKFVYPHFNFRVCLVNAIPMAVISSAIAIPSVANMVSHKKEFIIYESIFSDILGILLFNFIVYNDTFTGKSVEWIAFDFVTTIIVSAIFSILMIFFLDKTKMNIKFFLIIAILILLYAFGKAMHLSSLLLILIFGLVVNNIELFGKRRINKHINIDKINQSLKEFETITIESAFLIRTFFFVAFGFSLHLETIFRPKILITGGIILAFLYFLRFIWLKYSLRSNLFPELFIAPRGLITILLFYSIPQKYSIGVISEGVLFVVIIGTSLIMSAGIIGHQNIIKSTSTPELDNFLKKDKKTK